MSDARAQSPSTDLSLHLLHNKVLQDLKVENIRGRRFDVENPRARVRLKMGIMSHLPKRLLRSLISLLLHHALLLLSPRPIQP
jgi:hypothetical protein